MRKRSDSCLRIFVSEFYLGILNSLVITNDGHFFVYAQNKVRKYVSDSGPRFVFTKYLLRINNTVLNVFLFSDMPRVGCLMVVYGHIYLELCK